MTDAFIFYILLAVFITAYAIVYFIIKNFRRLKNLGMTDRQKEFRRQMKELEKEGLVEKQKFRTRSLKRHKGLGFIGAIFILWQIWAAMTWIFPSGARYIASIVRHIIFLILNLFT